MHGGYQEKILRVDLSTCSVGVSELNYNDAELYIGGRGLAAKILYDEVPAGTDPLGPDNKLIFMTGPLTGTRIPFTAKHVVVSKSPLTGAYTRSISGGFFSPELKFAAYDGLVISGRALHPVYLLIDNGRVEIRDASALWGKTIPVTEALIKQELNNPQLRIASIGPAGEKMVRFASIVNDTYRFAGRGGAGAVMGSKSLKAIAVTGNQPIKIGDPGLLEETMIQAYDDVLKHPTFTSRLRNGAMETVALVYRYGIASVRNFADQASTDWVNFDPHTTVEKYVVQEESCFACPHKCLKHTVIKSGPWAGAMAEGPKYETLCMFGANCENNDVASIIKANEICASYGIDSVSAGNVVAFAMECAEKGIISAELGDGHSLRFGSGESIVYLLELIANRQGLGDVLAEGVKRASESLGDGSQEFAMHVKGQEMGSFDPRGYPAMGLAYATSNRGACHMGPPFRLDPWWAEKNPNSTERWATTGKADVVVKVQNLYALLDSFMYCSFSRGGFNPHYYLTFFRAVTGRELSWEQADQIASNIYSLERSFNLREGLSAQDDMLPQRFLEGSHGLPMKDMLAEYYTRRGWNEAGVPNKG